jgi:hypothetical protein
MLSALAAVQGCRDDVALNQYPAALGKAMSANRRASLLAVAGLLLLASVTLFLPRYRTAATGSGGLASPFLEKPQDSSPLRSLGYLSSGSRPSSGPPAAEQTLEAMNAVRRRIRTGELAVEVKSFEKAASEAGDIAESHGGYLVTSEASRDDEDRREGTLTIRVAPGQFSAAFSAVKSLGEVQSEKIGTEDISKAYTDLQSRLQVKRQTERRLRDILQARTGKLSEVLEVERELGRLAEEIEQMEGQRRYYDQQVALSSITVQLQEPTALVRRGAVAPLTLALREALDVFMNSLGRIVTVTSFLAPWLLAAVSFWFLARIVWHRRGAR